MLIRFDGMYERDGHTPHDGIGRACKASRSKNGKNQNASTMRWYEESLFTAAAVYI